MSQDEIKKYISENLEIGITNFSGNYLTIQLRLEDKVISEDTIDVPNFSVFQDTPEWMR